MAHRPIRVAKRHRRNGSPNLWANRDLDAMLGNPVLRWLDLGARRLLAPLAGRA